MTIKKRRHQLKLTMLIQAYMLFQDMHAFTYIHMHKRAPYFTCACCVQHIIKGKRKDRYLITPLLKGALSHPKEYFFTLNANRTLKCHGKHEHH